MLKKVWTDPVWSKVIAAAIVAGLASVITYFGGWWPNIGLFLSSAGSLAVSSTSVPNWLLAVLVLCAIVVLVVVAIGLCATFFSQNVRPSYLTYAEDVVLGIRWRWRYGSDGAIYQLVSFCPNCDYQIHPRDVAAYRAVDHIGYRCEDCGALVGDFQMSLDEIESRVTRHIQKNLRTGTWSDVVKAQRRAAADEPQAARR